MVPSTTRPVSRLCGFTVLSMSLSLVAVFLPLLLMGGLPGRLLREFAVTLSVAIGISLAVSLTLTPMMCGWLLKSGKPHQPTRNRGFGPLAAPLQRRLQRFHPRLQMAGDILQHHDSVIHHEAGGDGQGHQRQVIEAEAAQIVFVRLQPQQPVADGPDHRHRLRGG